MIEWDKWLAHFIFAAWLYNDSIESAGYDNDHVARALGCFSRGIMWSADYRTLRGF